MSQTNSTEILTKHLDRILSFFPRVESKASLLFAVDTALLGTIATNLHVSDFAIWFICAPATIAIIAILASVYFCYRAMFPNLDGGEKSLIYFREIAARTEATFISEFEALNERALHRDFLGQIWRNSSILKSKFNAMKRAFSLTALALVPWVMFLATSAAVHGQLPFVK